MSLEAFLCRDATQFLAASVRKPKSSAPTTFRDSPDWNVYIAANAKRKLKLAESLTRRIVSFREVGGSYRRAEEVLRQQSYEARDSLRHASFRVRVTRRIGVFELPPGHAAFVARKPL